LQRAVILRRLRNCQSDKADAEYGDISARHCLRGAVRTEAPSLKAVKRRAFTMELGYRSLVEADCLEATSPVLLDRQRCAV
jgi:hypothetical protein